MYFLLAPNWDFFPLSPSLYLSQGYTPLLTFVLSVCPLIKGKQSNQNPLEILPAKNVSSQLPRVFLFQCRRENVRDLKWCSTGLNASYWHLQIPRNI